MAIVKPIKVRIGNLAGLRAVLTYIQDDAKTQNGSLVFFKDLLKGKEYQQMVITKRAFHKDSGRQYAHFVQSFSPKDEITPALAFEIGQDFIRRNEKWRDFQVMMAVHTNEPQLHIHYIINSVSTTDGRKWQSSIEDLKQMRALSDAQCREHGLSVIEHGNRGHKSYREYTATTSWKAQLAQDIAACLSRSHSKADFMHAMDELGIEVDMGKKSILFTLSAGVYGLQEERKCSNQRLLSYGDFSSENIKATWKSNAALADVGRNDVQILQDVLLEVGQLHQPDNPLCYQNMYFNNMDFEGFTKQEIEIALSRKALDALHQKARQAHQQAEAEKRQSGALLASVGQLLEELLTWKQAQENQLHHYTFEEENEYEL